MLTRGDFKGAKIVLLISLVLQPSCAPNCTSPIMNPSDQIGAQLLQIALARMIKARTHLNLASDIPHVTGNAVEAQLFLGLWKI